MTSCADCASRCSDFDLEPPSRRVRLRFPGPPLSRAPEDAKPDNCDGHWPSPHDQGFVCLVFSGGEDARRRSFPCILTSCMGLAGGAGTSASTFCSICSASKTRNTFEI